MLSSCWVVRKRIDPSWDTEMYWYRWCIAPRPSSAPSPQARGCHSTAIRAAPAPASSSAMRKSRFALLGRWVTSAPWMSPRERKVTAMPLFALESRMTLRSVSSRAFFSFAASAPGPAFSPKAMSMPSPAIMGRSWGAALIGPIPSSVKRSLARPGRSATRTGESAPAVCRRSLSRAVLPRRGPITPSSPA